MTAILNPASGPGTVADPNYVTATNNLRAAGGGVVGYVSTRLRLAKPVGVRTDISRGT